MRKDQRIDENAADFVEAFSAEAAADEPRAEGLAKRGSLLRCVYKHAHLDIYDRVTWQ